MDPYAALAQCRSLDQLDALTGLLIRIGEHRPAIQDAIAEKRRALEFGVRRITSVARSRERGSSRG
jgi:hypothetical protein